MHIVKPLSALAMALLISACAERQAPAKIEASTPQQQPDVIEADPSTVRNYSLAPAKASHAGLIARESNGHNTNVKSAYNRGRVQEQSKRLATPETYPGEFVSVARDMPGKTPYPSVTDREHYLHYRDNGVIPVLEQPVSTFSVDVDTASYANIRRMLVREGRLPPSDAVRLEEMINYFSYQYTAPDSREQPFSVSTELAPTPWSDNRYLLRIGLKGFEPDAEQRPPANLVFLVDVSGSMQAPDKLGLVKKSLRLLVNQMNAQDRIALVVYAGAAGVVLDSTPGNERAKILAAIDGLEASGSTHGSAGIKLAYQLAQQHKIEGGINRVLIASDGDMNVGTVNIEALKDLIVQQRRGGIALSTLGYGSGNYNYALMEQLADVGNGSASYIDSLKEAQKVLVNEMQSTLLTIASDVKIQVEFNPARVSEYRLIGYENRLLAREDFNNDKVDAGDIGAGHTVTALYEIVLVGSPGERLPELRYQPDAMPTVQGSGEAELAYVKLRYKTPGREQSVELGTPISSSSILPSLQRGSNDLRFAASVAGFGQILQGGRHMGTWSYTEALDLARNARGQDPYGYRSEFLRLLELAQSIAAGS